MVSRGNEWYRRALAALAGIVLALGMAAVASSPAQASVSPAGSNCDDVHGFSGFGMLCVYDNANYDTTNTVWNWYDIDFIISQGCFDTTMQTNTISSMSMNPTAFGQGMLTGLRLNMYPNDNCVGTPVMNWSATQHNWISNFQSTPWGNRNDTINSISIRNN